MIAPCNKRHRHQDLLVVLHLIDREAPADLDIHLLVDPYATHTRRQVQASIAKRPLCHVHVTPTYASWLNQVERWFGLISQRASKRNSFCNVTHLVQTVEAFTEPND